VRFLDTSPPSGDDYIDMIAVIGNVIAGIGVVSLFTATLRLRKGSGATAK
jgi:hypothetical protein